MRQASKILHEWNGPLEIFSRPQVIENYRNAFLNRYFTETSHWVPLKLFVSDL